MRVLDSACPHVGIASAWPDVGFFPTKDMQTPPLVLIRFLWMMWSVLNTMKNEIDFSSNFCFSSYHEKFIENWSDEVTRKNKTQKIKIGKI